MSARRIIRSFLSSVLGVATAVAGTAPGLAQAQSNAADMLSEPPPDPTAFAKFPVSPAPPDPTAFAAPQVAPQRPGTTAPQALKPAASGTPVMPLTMSAPPPAAQQAPLQAVPPIPSSQLPLLTPGQRYPVAPPQTVPASQPLPATATPSQALPQTRQAPGAAPQPPSQAAQGIPKLSPMTPKLAPPPTAPPAQGAAAATTPANSTGSNAPPDQNYPAVNKLEVVTFGTATPEKPIQERLSALEMAVFKKPFPNDSLFDRTERLKHTLIGPDDENPDDSDMRVPANNRIPRGIEEEPVVSPENAVALYYEQIALQPENQTEISREEQEKFALALINQERNRMGIGSLQLDAQAAEMAKKHVDDLCRRNVISHTNSKGENPDRRYTLDGGTGVLTESLVSLSSEEAGTKKHTRAQIARMLKTMMGRQDDREALLSPDATEIGFAANWTEDRQRMILCNEVICKRGIMHPIPHMVRIGDKIEVKGVLTQPYDFSRISIAWEGERSMSASSDESKEALPYFAPLDYVAYQNKSEHDYSGAMTALRTVGVLAAIAGGMFMPPVALAAPLIAMSGSTGEPKPMSDIPVHGGVKIEGSVFSGKIPISCEGKAGTYYVTVWASMGKYAKPFPVSRRAIVAKDFEEDVSATVEPGAKNEGYAKIEGAPKDEDLAKPVGSGSSPTNSGSSSTTVKTSAADASSGDADPEAAKKRKKELKEQKKQDKKNRKNQ